MADLEQQLNSILSNPELMNQLFAMAGNLGVSQPPPQTPPQNSSGSPEFDSIQNLMNLMKRTQLEPRQAELLRALGGYLPTDRLEKLRKAMLASKIARFASSAFSQSSGQGR